ncbi:MAG: excinuclease ABC subunit UvrC [bacterium]
MPKYKDLPNKPGVYFFKDRRGIVLYIGKAKSLRKRVASYFNREVDLKTSILLEHLHDIDYILVASEFDAILLEEELIKKYQPRYNIIQKDDKTHPYLKLTVNEEWPRLFLTRRKYDDGARYFGKFEGKLVREIIRLVKRLFPIRWCKETPLRMREQPCLYYRIGACAAPCVGKNNRVDYQTMVKGITALLEGKLGKALDSLKTEMTRASGRQDYEQAALLRDRISTLEKMAAGKELDQPPAPRKLNSLNALSSALKLSKPPMRIEAFDVSNIQGSNNVAAVIVFYGGVPLKGDYRKFKIRSVDSKANDVAAVYEAVKRRYTGMLAKKLPLPDLIVIDGGLGQVNAAAKALREAKLEIVPVIGLAKREELIFFPGQSKPLALRKSSAALHLLQRVRDEVHRFVLSYHRNRRDRALFD